MHLDLMGQLASQHVRERRGPGLRGPGLRGPGLRPLGLRTPAPLDRRDAVPQEPRSLVRHRAGWALVQIGLRLADTSCDG